LGRNRFAIEVKKLRRAEIVAAARRVLGQKGFERATVADICAEAEIAHGTFYHYFKDKLSVLEAVLDEFLQQVYEALAFLGSQPLSGAEEIRKSFEKGWQLLGTLFIENKDITRIFFQEAYRSGEVFDTRIKSFYKDLSRSIASYLERGIELGFLYPCDAEITADMIISAVERAFYKYVVEEVDESLESFTGKAALFVQRAIFKRPEEA
jgi:AcrR family transcriptional regulator